MKQLAEMKFELEDNVKQNFLEPLHLLQTKDIREVQVGYLIVNSIVYSSLVSN